MRSIAPAPPAHTVTIESREGQVRLWCSCDWVARPVALRRERPGPGDDIPDRGTPEQLVRARELADAHLYSAARARWG